MKIAFVVLHYKVSSITKECLYYLLEQDYENFEIIVVDNCSNNGSYEELLDMFDGQEKIYFLTIEHNLGFAKANDLGYQIAKHRFMADCIVVINNDLFIQDRLFSRKLESFDKMEKIEIMGPDIINKVGEHQNPLISCVYDKKTVQTLILKTRIKIVLLPFLYRVKTQINKDRISTNKLGQNIRMENVPLHGSCLIFGKKFISKYEFPFFPETFLYGEEDILYYQAKKRGVRTVYNSELVVHHVEDVSTESVSKGYLDKRLFELKNSLKSLLILKELIKKED